MNNEHEVREFAVALLDSTTLAEFLVNVFLDSSPPTWGSDDWDAYLLRSDLWLLAHARWRLAQRGVTDIQVGLHGRGIRVRSEARGLDVFCVEIYEFDRVLHEEITK